MANKLQQALPFIIGDPLVYVLSSSSPSPSSTSNSFRVSIAVEDERSGPAEPSRFCEQRAIVASERYMGSNVYMCCACPGFVRFACRHVKTLFAFAETVQDNSLSETIFDGMVMRSVAQAAQPAPPSSSHQPARPAVSTTRVPLNLFNGAMRQRTDHQGESLLSACAQHVHQHVCSPKRAL